LSSSPSERRSASGHAAPSSPARARPAPTRSTPRCPGA
jgi:hypothetical protein